MELLDAGINVISAVNIQHIESLNEEVQEISGIEVRERIPDRVLEEADEVVNIDLTAEELIERLKAGKIYRPEKIELALNNFFKAENILQLRELALKEVALRVEKKVENELPLDTSHVRHEKFMACISSQRPAKSFDAALDWLHDITQNFSYYMYKHPKRIPIASRWQISDIC